MRHTVSLAALALFLVPALACPPQAHAGIDDKQPDAVSIAALELRANQAQPKEQCFLYAELVHEMIEYSSAQYAAGDVDKAADTLKRVHGFAQKIHMVIANDEKRLKNAQILLRHTSFRLTELLHVSNIEDRPLVEETLSQLNAIQTETMMQVFKR